MASHQFWEQNFCRNTCYFEVAFSGSSNILGTSSSKIEVLGFLSVFFLAFVAVFFGACSSPVVTNWRINDYINTTTFKCTPWKIERKKSRRTFKGSKFNIKIQNFSGYSRISIWSYSIYFGNDISNIFPTRVINIHIIATVSTMALKCFNLLSRRRFQLPLW